MCVCVREECVIGLTYKHGLEQLVILGDRGGLEVKFQVEMSIVARKR